MRRILITGMSGTGKSSALDALAQKGFDVVDTDEPGWTVWSETDRGYVWREDRMTALLAAPLLRPQFISGAASNQGRFYAYFDEVALLSAPVETLLRRIARRDNNDFGKADAQRTAILRDLREVEPLMRRTCTIELDATQPLETIVDQLARLGVGLDMYGR